MSQTFEPTPEQLAALTHRFTRMPRGISRVFTGFGVVCGGLLLAVALVSPTVVLGPGLIAGVVAIVAVPTALGQLLQAVARARTRRLLTGTLGRGSGRITSIRRPDADGGPTRLILALTLPDGGDANGSLNTYHLQDAAEGDTLELWFAEDGRSFFPADLDVICDPGVVR